MGQADLLTLNCESKMSWTPNILVTFAFMKLDENFYDLHVKIDPKNDFNIPLHALFEAKLSWIRLLLICIGLQYFGPKGSC